MESLIFQRSQDTYRKILARSLKVIMAVVMSTVVFSGGFVPVAQAQSHRLSLMDISADADPSTKATDDDILKGLVFSTGPVAERMGSKVLLPAHITEADFAHEVDQAIGELKELYKDDLTASIRRVKSDDPIEVHQGLDDMSEIVARYADYKYPEIAQASVNTSPSGCGIVIVCVATTAVTVHKVAFLNAGVVVTAASAVFVVHWLTKWRTRGRFDANAASQETVVVDVMKAIRDDKIRV
ncbi:hypothetical protein P4N68_03230 [Corynebacterium felinum]|uniref:SdpC family antimicrobial peptide n=1 Tax=Corynebacterium felinum TaxID=131318 RepID=A0ABU2B5E5_9CORY|nr:hypothetical protein [Corynebacterium felinum]MDF5820096.1 hypothetical protein [Corynebacterium felinum]MDR7353840.1 SdpC family antimicrobial peptide [Corynebacterium felinum]WJY96016.1 Killing factor SdpC precursor [Corynebacterium felinum]